ncbi:MAG: DNA-directed RNA polymerase subunit alpha [bacterium]
MQITLPDSPKIKESKNNCTIFEIEGCYPGYGVTLGNAMRRVLLSSLHGSAITSIKIKGVQHEFSTIDGVMEDVVQIILNLKQVRFKFYADEPVMASLKIKGEKEVRAKDIKVSSEVEVVNPDAYITTLTTKKAELDMEIEIDSGLGYLPVERQKRGKLEVGKIAIDAIFSPVLKVKYSVEDMRVGDRTDYDRLTMTVETDGSITPEDAFAKAAKILVDHYNILTATAKEKIKEKKKKIEKSEKKKETKEKVDLSKTKLDDLKFSSRVTTALNEAGLRTAAGIARKTEDDLMNIEGLGKKGVVEIKRTLGRLGLTLKS